MRFKGGAKVSDEAIGCEILRMEVYRPMNERKKRKKKALQAWFKVKNGRGGSSGTPEAKPKIKCQRKQGRESEADAGGNHLAMTTSRNHHPCRAAMASHGESDSIAHCWRREKGRQVIDR